MRSKLAKLAVACVVAGSFLCHGLARAQSAEGRSDWPGAGQLFVGTNYQSVDRSNEQIERDIARMKQAGFKVVRVGDLSWDHFEPAEGKFDFKTFDWMMDEMHAAGLKVILDIPGQPAPIWLHHKYPGVDIVTQNGVQLDPAERYMDDISDPDYKRLLARMADMLTKRYAKHPALFAIGYNNEIGNGFISYSEADRLRFIGWLKKKYGSIETLNKAWATQRWSRHLNTWDEVRLPYADGPGPFERQLDLRRYWSDVTIGTLRELEAIRRRNAPDKPAISNLWDSAGRKGFDYLSTYRDYVSYGAMGFYPGEPLGAAFEATMMKGGLSTPIWFNEFTAGGGGYYGTKGRARMWAHFGLLIGAQAALAWTYHSHHGGEEQALFGLIDHDDRPSWKLDEFATIAQDFSKLEKLGFPRMGQPKVAIAYAFDNVIASEPKGPSNTVKQYINTPYLKQAHNAYEPLFKDNIDIAVINIGHEDLSRYSLVIVPGLYLLDKAAADNLRRFVAEGGTVIMTAYSAKVNEHNQWFDTSLPGRLTDVFGLRTNEFYNTGEVMTKIGGKEIKGDIGYYEVLEPSTAEVLARFTNVEGKTPSITLNKFGKGRAIYVGTPAQPQIMGPLYRQLYASLGIEPGPKTPDGVSARLVEGRVLYVNATGEPKGIAIDGTMTGVLSGKRWTGELRLESFGVDLLEK
ncbi:beta-galactosidase [Pseudoxanthomonas sacheonensis]|uniref:beta-galactosidase n=1 Tax=Pseudoxanthomonas sacheonensis TaxID=443615 RepID=A0ABU1RV68_9GAMM|nr:beta-galactosidase [Pseudoxanthomonas sacheonensis]MDR6842666.1 beta-galactosidase [Pseudoxanthomonas sacheonensis]